MSFKIKTLSALTAVAALSLASCSSEEPLNNDNNTTEREGIGYMSFTIANPADGTRADNDRNPKVDGDQTATGGEIFNNGSANEYAICPNNSANAAFFFSEGKFWGMSNLQSVNNNGSHASHDNYAEKYYTYMTRWRNDGVKAKPDQVIVILNADPSKLETIANEMLDEPVATNDLAKFLANESVFTDEVNETGYKYGIYNYADEKYFTMSSSVFFDDNDENQTLTTIDENWVCETAEEALNHPVTVYVERLLAKFQLGFGEDSFEFGKDGDFIFYPFNDALIPEEKKPATINFVSEYTGTEDNLDYPKYERKEWAAYIVSWGINGLEKKASLIKKVSNTTYFDNWNAPLFHRSYWGESNTYELYGKPHFTTQYRYEGYDPDAKKFEDTFFGNSEYSPSTESSQLGNALHYISYNDLRNRAAYKYTAERTYNAEEGRKAYGPYRYASHYLIGAQLLIAGVDYEPATGKPYDNDKEQNVLSKVNDKYYAYNFYFNDVNSYIRYAYHRMASKFADGREHSLILNGRTLAPISTSSTGTLYKDVNGTPISVQEAADYFTIQSAQIIHGDGKVTLKAKENPIYYKNGEGKYIAFSEEQLIALVYNCAEAARHYNKGAMYYAIPVQHKLGKTFGDMVKINKDAAELYALGQFGVVRNHWYRLTVNTIGSIGIPVDNPDQPIIPDPEDEYYIAIEIVVLPWHIIDNGKVDL